MTLSNHSKAKFMSKVFDFWQEESLSKNIGYHIFNGTIYKPNLVFLNNLANKVVMNIDVFFTYMILVIFCECNSMLFV